MENAKLNVLELLTIEQCKEAIAKFPAQISEICDRMLQISKQRKAAPPAEKTLKEFLAGQPGDLIAYLTYQVCKDLEVDFLDVSKSSAVCMAIFAANGVASTAQGGTRQKTQALRNLLAAGVVKVVPTEDPVIKKYENTLLGLDDKEPDMFENIRRYAKYVPIPPQWFRNYSIRQTNRSYCQRPHPTPVV